MSISSNYQQPELVNGYVCWNCHQVSEAQKDINPNPPKSADGQPATGAQSSSSAVVFGGALAGASSATGSSPAPSPLLNILA